MLSQEGGIRAFWRGNGANVAKIMPESGVKFFAYNYAKEWLVSDPEDVKVYERLIVRGSTTFN